MKPYNDSPGAALDASQALLERGREILADKTRVDEIWSNLGFHAATVRLEEAGCPIPHGPHAQAYIGLILAAADHVKAQERLEEALIDTGLPDDD